ncbi:hypothetical protein E2C01_043957 [Portunus trituberculatus]|uniref:Uncharacterized protein n=1 Tax=Portunus trituberculatus TaxID=210409 RepID=A0A5B7FXS7_PORTR|nr:hypothetical protein [Portunus trituberculatus]
MNHCKGRPKRFSGRCIATPVHRVCGGAGGSHANFMVRNTRFFNRILKSIRNSSNNCLLQCYTLLLGHFDIKNMTSV